MSNAYINVYKGNPTAGGTDGTAVSTGGTYTEPITVALNASEAETKKVKLAIRCETGYTTVGDTMISDSGDTDDRWKLCLTENGTYADSITITSAISTTNVIFWAQVSSATAENPGTDRTVSLAVSATITAV